MKQKLRINQYEVQVSLGCSKEEQSILQKVSFDIQIDFSKMLQASQTDQLDQTIDYSVLTNFIEDISKQKSYQLIENLGYLVHQQIKDYIKSKNISGQLETTVKKLNPPLVNLKGGVSFTCVSDLQD